MTLAEPRLCGKQEVVAAIGAGGIFSASLQGALTLRLALQGDWEMTARRRGRFFSRVRP
jgi:hypothetical protein